MDRGMDRLETRELSYFVAVAEELHFGRAARRLGIAQPPLSRAIKQLERRLGVSLLERDSRRVALTVAGEVLLHEARKALDAVAAAGRRAQRAGRSERRLVLVMKPGSDAGLLPDVLVAYESEPDALPVEVLVCGMGEQGALLRAGRADIGLLYVPYNEVTGFDTEELLAEHQVAVLPRRHRLAGRAHVRVADLAGETVPRWSDRSAPDGASPEVRDAGQLMQLIALGRAVAVVPESARGHIRHDLVCVPVLDAPVTTVVLAWPQGSRSRAVAAFVRAATAVARHRQPRLAVLG